METGQTNLLENILQSMGDAFVSLDRQWRYSFVNDKALSLMGMPKENLLGRTLWEVFPDTVGTVFDREYRRVMEERVPSSFETHYPSYDMWLEVRAYPHEDGIAIFYTDITKHKNAEALLKRMNVELEICVRERTAELADALARAREINELKTRFVSIASHEFRTPLSAIISSVSLLERYAQPDQHEHRARHIQRIKSSAKNLHDILAGFLSVDKLEQGKVIVEKESFHLPVFIREVIEEVDGIRKDGQRIHHTHQGGTEVLLDKKILRNILLNLLSNAIKYSDREIHLRTEVADWQVVLSVTDRGIGIPAEEQQHLFTRFFRARNTGSIPGTGLGLNIVQAYVELLNGSIRCDSNGEGTTFRVELPREVEKG